MSASIKKEEKSQNGKKINYGSNGGETVYGIERERNREKTQMGEKMY